MNPKRRPRPQTASPHISSVRPFVSPRKLAWERGGSTRCASPPVCGWANAGEAMLMTITAASNSGKINFAARRQGGTHTVSIRLNPPDIFGRNPPVGGLSQGKYYSSLNTSVHDTALEAQAQPQSRDQSER